MNRFERLFRIAAVAYALGFGSAATIRYLRQRDEEIAIARLQTALRGIEIQGSVHCDGS